MRAAGVEAMSEQLERQDAESKIHFLEKLHGCDVMVKPVDTRELIAKIRSSVRIKRCVERAARAAGERPIPMISDELAGSCSRGFLEAMIAQEARRAERHGGTFSLLLSALEGFEQFKKAFGHEWVRAAIRHAAWILRHSTRECDVRARLDESRFALLLPGTGSEGLPALRSRLKVDSQRLPIEFHGRWMKTPVLLGTDCLKRFWAKWRRGADGLDSSAGGGRRGIGPLLRGRSAHRRRIPGTHGFQRY